jgi:hypothetical protein
MACGCKGNTPQTKQTTPTVIRTDGAVEIMDVTNPNYTIEEIIRMKDYINSTNKTELERKFIADMLLTHFGDLIPDYCDNSCIKHISNRIKYMEDKLNQYMIFNLNK